MTEFQIVSLGSSSEGNCFLIVTKEESFFIDLGIGFRDLMQKLRFLKVSSLPSTVLLSHEHGDHTTGIRTFSKKFPITIYANVPTFKNLNNAIKNLGVETEIFTTGEVFQIGKTKIKSFPVYHDAAEPVGFTITYGKHKVVYLMDSGRVEDKSKKEMADADLVIIDSNYDDFSLLQGKYPDTLKKRIMCSGHLSNEVVGNIILNHPNPQTEFWLGHLSKEHNSPGLASVTVNYILKYGKGQKRRFKILPRKGIGPIWDPAETSQLEFMYKSGMSLSKP